MKTHLLSIAAAALLATSAAAPAAKTTQSEEAKAAQAAAADGGGKKICKRLQTSGTRLGERTCLSKQDWKKLENMD